MGDYESILLEIDSDGVARLTLNRPDKLNAMNRVMQKELDDAAERLAADDDVRVIVITGAGRAFCAGGDIDEMRGGSKEGPWASDSGEEVRRSFEHAQSFMLAFHRMEKPVIAMVNGPALGAGLDLACVCDLRIGSPQARFMSAYVHLGLFPGFGGTWLYPRVFGSLGKAAEMLFTGEYMEAEEAYRIGFLNRLVPAEELERTTMDLVKKLAASPPIALRLAKVMLYRGLEYDMETAMKMAASAEAITLTSRDHAEAVKAFREKRSTRYKGV
jgi:enoyl-CoA hydratase/carnithine racemase